MARRKTAQIIPFPPATMKIGRTTFDRQIIDSAVKTLKDWTALIVTREQMAEVIATDADFARDLKKSRGAGGTYTRELMFDAIAKHLIKQPWPTNGQSANGFFGELLDAAKAAGWHYRPGKQKERL